jgi:hypothetical protein
MPQALLPGWSQLVIMVFVTPGGVTATIRASWRPGRRQLASAVAVAIAIPLAAALVYAGLDCGLATGFRVSSDPGPLCVDDAPHGLATGLVVLSALTHPGPGFLLPLPWQLFRT